MPNTGGRPPLPAGHARTRVVAVRLTESGYSKVEVMAKAKGMSVPEYVRLTLKRLYEGSIICRLDA